MTAFPMQSLSRLDEDLSPADKETFEEAKVKRSLHNAFDTPIVVKKRVSRLSENFQQMPIEYMKVFLRLRPFTEKEMKEKEDQKCMKVSDDRHILTVLAPKDSKMYKTSSRGVGESVRHFTFTKIFDEATGQKEFFNETASPLVQSFIDGKDALIFTYGVTNAGKTYTIQGSQGNEGIIPRAIDHLFESVGDKLLEDVTFHPKMANNLCFLTKDDKLSHGSIKDEVLSMADDSITSLYQSSNATLESSGVADATNLTVDDTVNQSRSHGSMENYTDGNIDGTARYAVFASFVEVYKELTYDLLTPLPEDKRHARPVLAITDDGKGASYVKGMREIQVNSPEEVMKILSVGRKNLHVAATKINKDSSRSHCIFTLTLVQVENIPEPRGGRVSKISFCDLAGSERANKTREVGDRLKEAGKINQSLMKLGMCIEAIRHNQRNEGDKQKQRAVSFRDSKLTRLFRSYLLGKGRACMVVNANMCASVFDETAQVLKFSAIAKDIQIINKPKDVEKKKSRVTLFEEKFESSMKAAATGKRPRATIAWERKLTPVKDVEEKEDDNELEDSEEESDESDSGEEEGTSAYDVDFWKDRERKFRDIIDVLKKALSDVKIKGQQKETELRNELAQHHQNQMVDIETRHEKNIEDTISMMEDEQEKRVKVATELANIDLREMKERFQRKYTTIEKDLEERSTKLQTVEDKVTEYELQNNMLKMELDKMKIDLENKDKENASVQKQLRRSRYSGGMNVDDLMKENEEGRCIIQSLVEETDGYKQDLEEAHGEIAKLNEALKVAGEKNEEILLQNNSKKDDTDHQEYEKLKLTHSELEEKVTIIEKQSLELRNIIGNQDEQDAMEEGALSNTEDFLRNITDWINTKEQYVLQLTNGIEEEKSDKSNLENDLSKTKIELQEMKEKFETSSCEISQKDDKIGLLNEEITKLQEKIDQESESKEKELNDVKENYVQEMEDLNEKLRNLEGSFSELDGARKQILDIETAKDELQQKFENDILALKNQIESLESEKKNIEKNFEALTAEFEIKIEEANNNTEKVKDQMSKEVENAATELADAKKTMREHQKEVGENKKFEQQLVKETNRLHEEVENLKKENLKVKETSQKRTSDASDLLRDVDILTRDRNDLLVRVDSLQKSLDEANVEKTRLEKEFRENVSNTTTVQSNTELLGLKSIISENESLVNKLESENRDLLKNQENLEKKVSELQNCVLESEKLAETEKSDFSVKIEKVREERNEIDTKLQEKQSDITKLEKRLRERDEECENFTKQVDQLKQIDCDREKENQQMADKIEKLQKEFENEQNEKKLMEKDRQNLQEKILTLEENLRKNESEKENDIETKKEVDKNVNELTEQINKKQSKLNEMEKELMTYKTNSEKEAQNIHKDSESQISALKKSHEKEIKKLEKQNEKTVEAKEKELTAFRENRDRIVAALEVQIKNDKSTNEILKENLDEQMSENVRLKSQNAAFSAENAELNKQMNSNTSGLAESALSTVVVMDKLTLPIKNIKSEPMSPKKTPSPRKRTSKMMSPAKSSSESDHNTRTVEENVPPVAVKRTSSRGARGRKRGSSTRSRGSRRTATRPATPYCEEPPVTEETVPSPKKSRQSTRGSRSASIKEEVNTENEEQGVLDDSELLRETGHSHNFPKPTMELDVTPQVSKKSSKSRKRTNKKEEQIESETAEKESSPLFKRFKFLDRFINSEEADVGSTSSLRSSTRKTRANANNSNNSKTSDEENTTMSVAKNLTKVGGMIRNSPVGQALKCIEAKISPAMKSPRKAKNNQDENEPPKRTRRLVKLQADDISLPLEATPSPDCGVRGRQPTHSVSETPARMMRRLRKRK